MTIKFYALFNKQYEYDFILKKKEWKIKRQKAVSEHYYLLYIHRQQIFLKI